MPTELAAAQAAPAEEAPEQTASDQRSMDAPSPDAPDPATLGLYTAFDYSDEPFLTFDYVDAEARIHELIILASRTDVASRRFEVEQGWEARLFERGYQHLLPRRGGGWSLPGENTQWGPLSTADSSALYATNTYGRDKDIIVAAIAREVPVIEFFPKDAANAVDVLAAEGANTFKSVYEKNNDLRARLAEIAYYFYTEDRCILYTRQVRDANQFGLNEQTGEPRGREITTVHGKLEGKVPMQAQYQREMHFIQLYNEIDVSSAKAKYPWIADKIRPGSCGIGEIELDKIARVNTKLNLLGSYVTGDAMMRDVTEQYTWIRPDMYWDETIPSDFRDELLDKAPRGLLIVYAGQVYAFARQEAMDDKLVVAHAMNGQGQNRRALGTNAISVQKRLNAYFDLMDDFFRRTVPRRLYDNDAFNVRALQQQDNMPGGSIPFQRQPGVPVDQLVLLEPTPQPQPSLPEFVKLFFEDIPASLTGALPSLFGASTNTDTVGGIQIQRDQALARIGGPWNSAKAALTESCRQAVIAAAERQETINESLPDGSVVSLDPNVLRGNVVCYPEYDQSFPESWKERELRFSVLAQGAATNPFYASLLGVPENMRAVADNLRMTGLKVPGEDSVKKQLIELDQLKESGPLPNPMLLQATQQLDGIKAGMAQSVIGGEQIPPEAPAMLQQAEAALSKIPPEVPSVPVEQDQSVNHAIEAKTVFDWLNSEEGLKFKNGTAEQQAAFANCHLHWEGHMAQVQEPAKGQPPHISVSYKGDLGPDENAQILSSAGIKTSPQSMANAKLVDTQHEIAKKIVPKTVPESINVTKMKNDAAAKAEAAKQNFGGGKGEPGGKK